MTAALNWVHKTSEIPDEGLSLERRAGVAELDGLAKALEITGCEQLLVRYTLHPVANDRFRVRGELEADVVQSCIVTLDPVRTRIAESFEFEFWPSEAIASHRNVLASGDQEVFAPDDPEAIVAQRLEIGRVIEELLAVALEPYPRAPGASLDPLQDQASDTSEESDGPFAALADWKPKRE